MFINGYQLKMTCCACPEQYDVFKESEQVGYLRLRHGSFTADYTFCDDKEVYYAEPSGNGVFYEDEREYFLTHAINAIDKEHNKKQRRIK